MMNDLRAEYSDPFRWQDGYACFSIWRNELDRVTQYICMQKEHHASGSVWPEWEQTDKPAPIQT